MYQFLMKKNSAISLNLLGRKWEKELQTVNRELWDRLKKEFLANQGISELAQGWNINLTPVGGSKYGKGLRFYKNLSRILMHFKHSRKAKCCMDFSWLPWRNFKSNQTLWEWMTTGKVGQYNNIWRIWLILYRYGWEETVHRPAPTT